MATEQVAAKGSILGTIICIMAVLGSPGIYLTPTQPVAAVVLTIAQFVIMCAYRLFFYRTTNGALSSLGKDRIDSAMSLRFVVFAALASWFTPGMIQFFLLPALIFWLIVMRIGSAAVWMIAGSEPKPVRWWKWILVLIIVGLYLAPSPPTTTTPTVSRHDPAWDNFSYTPDIPYDGEHWMAAGRAAGRTAIQVGTQAGHKIVWLTGLAMKRMSKSTGSGSTGRSEQTIKPIAKPEPEPPRLTRAQLQPSTAVYRPRHPKSKIYCPDGKLLNDNECELSSSRSGMNRVSD